MLGRRNLVAGMAGLLATLAAGTQAQADRIDALPAAAPDVMPPAGRPEEPASVAASDAAVPPDDELLHLAQWGYPPPPPRRHWHRRRPRCWIEPRRIAVRDRWGRIHYRVVEQRVCRR